MSGLRRLLLSLLAFLCAVPALAQTPTFVTSRCTSNANETATTPFKFTINYPGATGSGTLANNFVKLTLVYSHGLTAPTVSDNKSSTYTLAKSADGGVNNLFLADYIVPNAASGINKVTVTFAANVGDFRACMQEFYNLSTSSGTGGMDGSCNATTSPSNPTINCSASFTPTTSGDMIFADAVDLGEATGLVGGGSEPTAITAGSGFTLSDSDFPLGAMSEYRVYNSVAAITPSFSVTQGAADDFDVVAFAVKAATSGTAPPTSGIVINHILDLFIKDTAQKTGFPSSGNTIVLPSDSPNSATFNVITSVTSSPSNTFTKYANSSNDLQGFWVTSASTGATLTLTINNNTPGNNTMVHIIDLSGVSTHDTDAHNTCGSGCGNTVTSAPSITAAVANEFIAGSIAIGLGPTTASTQFFMNTPYSGETDAGHMNNGNGWAIDFPAASGSQSFGWTQTNSSTWEAIAMAFEPTVSSSSPTINKRSKLDKVDP